MLKNTLAPLLIILVLTTAIGVMIVPTFFLEKNSHKSLNKEIDLKLILENNKELAIVFFGYAACTDICTPRMESIAKFYNTLDDTVKQNLEIDFLDISKPIDKTLPLRYAEYFNSDFRGIYLNEKI